MLEKILLFSAICITKVISQQCPISLSCQQRGVPVSASPPIFIRASPSPPISPTCPSLAKPCLQKQQIVMPLEYSMTNPILPQTLPSCAPTISPFYLPLEPAVTCATEFVVPTCLPEPVFDIIGCLDPILSSYSTITDLTMPELACPPISPFLPAASPVSIVTPTLSSECSCHFLKKIAIPPPFI